MTQPNAHPTLRKDLRLSRLETPEGPRFVVKDPRTRRFFQLREAEYAVVRRLDGATPLDVVARDVSAELGAELDASALEPFLEQLRRIGLLEGAAAPPTQRRLFQGNLLWLRLKAFDPDPLLNRLIGKVRFCFTPHFLAVSVALFLLAVGVTVTNGDAIAQDLRGLWRVQNLLLAWLTLIVVTTGHEFAHGLTCKRFGGEVHEMGLLLIYFQPAFYCNISDAWLFPEKSKRLWVTAAGACFELLVWAVATLVWRVVEHDTWISGLALVVMATSGIKIFFNLNPLIKLDGYYLLSDLLDVPNLRARAFGYIGSRLKRLLGFTLLEPPTPTPRERRIFLGFGLLAAAFSYWLLGSIALRFGSYLTWRYEGWGFVMFTGLLTVAFWTPIRRVWPGRTMHIISGTTCPSCQGETQRTRRRRRDRLLAKLLGWNLQRRSCQSCGWSGLSKEPSPSASAPTETTGEPGTPSSPLLTPKRRLLALVAGALILLFVIPFNLTVSGELSVLPAHNADVRAEVEGIIERIYVAEGDRVAAGDTIARLADHEYRSRLRMVEAEVGEKSARHRLLTAGPRAQEIQVARLAVAKVEERLRYARADLERVQALAASDAASRVEVDRAKEQVDVLTAELREARGQLEVLLAGSRPEEIAAVGQEIVRLNAERERLQDQLRRAVIVSPHSGVVTTPNLEENVGQFVAPGDLVTEVHAVQTMRAEITVSERDIGLVEIGQRGRLRLRAYPEQTFNGRVTAIAPAAVAVEGYAGQGGRTVRVEIEIDNSSGLLKPGLTGYARIYTGKRSALDVLTRRFRRFLRVEFWSWW